MSRKTFKRASILCVGLLGMLRNLLIAIRGSAFCGSPN